MIEIFLIAMLFGCATTAIVENKTNDSKQIRYSKTYRLPAPEKCESCSFVNGTNKFECKVVYCTK